MKQSSRILGAMIFFLCMLLLPLIITSRAVPIITRTIKSADGDIIDCVDAYKQPAFQHALLKKHTIIEVQPPNFSRNINTTTSNVAHQVWHKSGKCPDKTIPVRKMAQKAKVMSVYEQCKNAWKIEYSGITAKQEILGARANINVWSLKVEPNACAVSAINIHNGRDSYIQCGWMVSPTLFEDDGKPRLFIRSVVPSRGIDCLNLGCTGFIQVSNEYALGAALAPSSQYGGEQYDIPITLYKDDTSSRWSVMYGESVVGYWPLEQFPELAKSQMVFWGGQVCSGRHGKKNHIASKMMRSTFLLGCRKSAYIRGIEVIDTGAEWRRPHRRQRNNTTGWCYMTGVRDTSNKECKECVYFGGLKYFQGCVIPCCDYYDDHVRVNALPLTAPRNFPSFDDLLRWQNLAAVQQQFQLLSFK